MKKIMFLIFLMFSCFMAVFADQYIPIGQMTQSVHIANVPTGTTAATPAVSGTTIPGWATSTGFGTGVQTAITGGNVTPTASAAVKNEPVAARNSRPFGNGIRAGAAGKSGISASGQIKQNKKYGAVATGSNSLQNGKVTSTAEVNTVPQNVTGTVK